MTVSCMSLLAVFGEFGCWFSIVATWTLWPLLVVDRLELAYLASMGIYLCLLYYSTKIGNTKNNTKITFSLVVWKLVLFASSFGMVGLHVLEIMGHMEFIVKIPSHLPDLFPVLWSVGGCAMLLVSWAVSCWKLYVLPVEPDKGRKQD
mmetsp:Transcript_30219/g.46276  ORF Transcript_30219/g.46276 Transcript_30219/m.46276 type:complete len:148 (-) Transcript_30219:826-1269(-)